MEIFYIIIPICLGAITAYYAKDRGRDYIGWFIIGLLFGLIGLIVLFLLPVKNQQPKEKETLEVTPVQEEVDPTEWYYLDDSRKEQGPLNFTQIKDLWQRGTLNAKSYVWNDTMTEWQRINELQEFQEFIK